MYAIVTRSYSGVWCGPGFARLRAGAVLERLPLWPDRASAERAACAMRKAMGVDVIPAPVRVGRK
jgi:hypothetical protein